MDHILHTIDELASSSKSHKSQSHYHVPLLSPLCGALEILYEDYMKIIQGIQYLGFCSLISATACADNILLNGLTISKLRSVGNYSSGSTYDNTVEVWFSSPLSLPPGSVCTDTRRVYVDASNTHIVSAAYMAFAAGNQVNVNVDSVLPVRSGACEVSFLDVNQ